MKLGIFTYGYMRFSLEKAFMDASRYGYDGIEIWGGRPHAYPFDLEKMGTGEIRKLSRKYSVPIIGYTPELNMYPYNMMIGSEHMRRESIQYIKTSMDVAREMNAGFTLISAGHAGYNTLRSEYWPRLIENLRNLANYAEEIDTDLVLEPLTQYETNVIVTCNDLVEALEEVDSPRLMGMCDICPPFCNHEPIMTYFEKLGPRLRHMHIIDSDGHSDTHLMPGEGRIPLTELFSQIESSKYEGYCTIELVSQYINEPSLGSAMAIRRVKQLIDDFS
jgi:protein FrlC